MNKKLTISIAILLSAAILVLNLIAPTAHAATSGLYLSPSGSNYAYDSDFSVQLRLGNGKSGVNANLTFDTSKLMVTSTSATGSAYPGIQINYDNNAGTISAKATNGNSVGDELVGTISFHAIGSGTANVSFSGTNQIMNVLLIVQIWSNVGTTNSSYSIGAVPTQSRISSPIPYGGSSTSNPTISSQSVNNSTGISSPTSSLQIIIPPNPANNSPLSLPSTSHLAMPQNIDHSNFDTSGLVILPIPDSQYSVVIPTSLHTATKQALQHYVPITIAASFLMAVIAIFSSYRRSRILESIVAQSP